jgi:large subunit ribosomal protein L10
MPKEKKAKVIDSLQELFSKSRIGILTDYRGLPTAEMNNLRRKLKEAGVEYKVVKNTLAHIAAQKAGIGEAAESFSGPLAIAFGYGGESELAKVLMDYIRSSKSTISIKGGFLRERLLTAKEVETLASLPSKEVLISKVMAGMQSPIYSLVSVLSAPMREVMGVLQARIRQLEGN